MTMLTTREVADRFGVAVPTVCRWVLERKLAAAQKLPGLTGSYLFDPAVVDAFAADRDEVA